jgi:membrane protein implicated in regulation of membrane protease activity
VAIAFGASAWLLLMATLIVALSRGLGWPWPLSLLLTAVLSVAITLYAGWRAMRYFEHTRLKATRRQFARLGLGELADLMPDADSPDSTAQAAERVAAATADAPIKKGLGVDVTPP